MNQMLDVRIKFIDIAQLQMHILCTLTLYKSQNCEGHAFPIWHLQICQMLFIIHHITRL